MQNREIGFISVMIMLSLPLTGVIYAMCIYLFLEKLFKKIKDTT